MAKKSKKITDETAPAVPENENHPTVEKEEPTRMVTPSMACRTLSETVDKERAE